MGLVNDGKCPFLGMCLTSPTDKYLLEMKYSQELGDVQLGHLPTPDLVGVLKDVQVSFAVTINEDNKPQAQQRVKQDWRDDFTLNRVGLDGIG